MNLEDIERLTEEMRSAKSNIEVYFRGAQLVTAYGLQMIEISTIVKESPMAEAYNRLMPLMADLEISAFTEIDKQVLNVMWTAAKMQEASARFREEISKINSQLAPGGTPGWCEEHAHLRKARIVFPSLVAGAPLAVATVDAASPFVL